MTGVKAGDMGNGRLSGWDCGALFRKRQGKGSRGHDSAVVPAECGFRIYVEIHTHCGSIMAGTWDTNIVYPSSFCRNMRDDKI